MKLRRRAWQGREVPTRPEAGVFAQAAPHPAAGGADRAAPRPGGDRHGADPDQREVLVSLALNGVPIDVLAERME